MSKGLTLRSGTLIAAAISLGILLSIPGRRLLRAVWNRLDHPGGQERAQGKQAPSKNAGTTATNAGEGPMPGRRDDGQASPPSDYTTWTPPAMGGSFTDPVYGSTIIRLSNGLAQFKDPVHHEYASMSPFNKDNTRVLLLTDNTGFFVADLRGNVIARPDEVGLTGLGEPRWSTTDPNVFFYHGYQTNQIWKFDLRTKRKTVLQTFPQFKAINFGGGESDISEDGDHMVIVGDERHVGLYTFSTNTLGPMLDTRGQGFDFADVTPDNNVIFRWDSQGDGRFKGFELFDRNMNFLRQVYPYGAHSDRGRDLNGDEILVILAATDLQPPPGCEGNGIEKILLKDGKKSCLMALNWDVGVHISANGGAGNPWVLVEATDERSETAKPNATLPPDWRTRWKPYYNEIILIKKDGSEVRRVAHHRSRALDDYWYTPRAAISRDGAYAVFDSNFGSSPMRGYTDVFLLDLKRSIQ